MARNKYPEETERKIMEVSQRLFATKGYEHTTIADIVQALGMSKGAVYHHFRSKEEIYDRITDQYYNKQAWFWDVNQLPGENGLEKMRRLFCFLLSDPEKIDLDSLSGQLSKNPRFLALALESTVRDAAPLVQKLIELGNADGSLSVAKPQETAEVFMLIINLWIGVFSVSQQDFMEKFCFLQELAEKMGLPVLDQETMDSAWAYYHKVVKELPKD